MMPTNHVPYSGEREANQYQFYAVFQAVLVYCDRSANELRQELVILVLVLGMQTVS